MSNTAGILYKTGPAYHSTAPGSTPVFFMGAVFLVISVFCVVCLVPSIAPSIFSNVYFLAIFRANSDIYDVCRIIAVISI